MLPQPPQSKTGSKPLVPKARIVVIEKIYHQEVGKQPTNLPDWNYTRWLDTDEQPYVRHMTLGEDWKPLDMGWVERVSLCVIANEYKSKRIGHSGPTEEQKAEAVRNRLEISLRGDDRVDITLYPGESTRIPFPTSPSEIRIRLAVSVSAEPTNNTIKCLLTLLPG